MNDVIEYNQVVTGYCLNTFTLALSVIHVHAQTCIEQKRHT